MNPKAGIASLGNPSHGTHWFNLSPTGISCQEVIKITHNRINSSEETPSHSIRSCTNIDLGRNVLTSLDSHTSGVVVRYVEFYTMTDTPQVSKIGDSEARGSEEMAQPVSYAELESNSALPLNKQDIPWAGANNASCLTCFPLVLCWSQRGWRSLSEGWVASRLV